ncbi:RHS repeat-associated core domain-containing protein, partial [Lonsdalea quercina]
YRYDPFGRRVSKRCAERGEAVRYLWDGDQIAEVRHYRQGQQTSRRHWVHNGWELVVQQRHTAAGGWETDFVSSAPNGAPQALYDSEGELRWQAPKATLWGQRTVAETESADPGLAFAGQLRDSESGLCYNRFRYYDPAGGGYISPDPIGVLGGDNLYAYAPNPLTWIDPLGLAKCGTGEYKDVGGHHIHAKAGFKSNPKYDPKKGFSISQDYMDKMGLDHQAMTSYQRQAFKELYNSGRPNTLAEHTKIAVNALESGGATTQQARSLVAESLWNLRSQGAISPSNIPWYK